VIAEGTCTGITISVRNIIDINIDVIGEDVEKNRVKVRHRSDVAVGLETMLRRRVRRTRLDAESTAGRHENILRPRRFLLIVMPLDVGDCYSRTGTGRENVGTELEGLGRKDPESGGSIARVGDRTGRQED